MDNDMDTEMNSGWRNPVSSIIKTRLNSAQGRGVGWMMEWMKIKQTIPEIPGLFLGFAEYLFGY